jgi:acetylornithine/succinyldiaminopimelate/putrescine aminotransferase
VSWIKRRDVADIRDHVTENTAAVIVEPVQASAARSTWAQEFLAALRKRCDETGALADLRRGAVRRRSQRHAVRGQLLRRDADMITTAKALGNGVPRVRRCC